MIFLIEGVQSRFQVHPQQQVSEARVVAEGVEREGSPSQKSGPTDQTLGGWNPPNAVSRCLATASVTSSRPGAAMT